jgi:ActR/RegA family two-component response regulator
VTADGLVLCDDLIFFSRIAAAARTAGLTVRQVKCQQELLALAKLHPPPGVIIDLQNEGLQLDGFLAELRVAAPAVRVVAYGSHLLADALRAARAAGCDRVMPRSQFVEKLEGEIAAWLAPPA